MTNGKVFGLALIAAAIFMLFEFFAPFSGTSEKNAVKLTATYAGTELYGNTYYSRFYYDDPCRSVKRTPGSLGAYNISSTNPDHAKYLKPGDKVTVYTNESRSFYRISYPKAAAAADRISLGSVWAVAIVGFVVVAGVAVGAQYRQRPQI
jgi:hypothetical protein